MAVVKLLLQGGFSQVDQQLGDGPPVAQQSLVHGLWPEVGRALDTSVLWAEQGSVRWARGGVKRGLVRPGLSEAVVGGEEC